MIMTHLLTYTPEGKPSASISWDDMSFFESMYSDHIYLLLASDITALAKDKAYAQIHLDDMTVHQVNLLAEAKIHPFSIKCG